MVLTLYYTNEFHRSTRYGKPHEAEAINPALGRLPNWADAARRTYRSPLTRLIAHPCMSDCPPVWVLVLTTYLLPIGCAPIVVVADLAVVVVDRRAIPRHCRSMLLCNPALLLLTLHYY